MLPAEQTSPGMLHCKQSKGFDLQLPAEPWARAAAGGILQLSTGAEPARVELEHFSRGAAGMFWQMQQL